MKKIFKNRVGAAVIEYALLMFTGGVVAFVAVSFLANAVQDTFERNRVATVGGQGEISEIIAPDDWDYTMPDGPESGPASGRFSRVYVMHYFDSLKDSPTAADTEWEVRVTSLQDGSPAGVVTIEQTAFYKYIEAQADFGSGGPGSGDLWSQAYINGEIGAVPTPYLSAIVEPIGTSFCAAIDPYNFYSAANSDIRDVAVDDVETFDLRQEQVPASAFPTAGYTDLPAFDLITDYETLDDIWSNQDSLEVVTAVRCSREWISDDNPVTGQMPDPYNWSEQIWDEISKPYN